MNLKHPSSMYRLPAERTVREQGHPMKQPTKKKAERKGKGKAGNGFALECLGQVSNWACTTRSEVRFIARNIDKRLTGARIVPVKIVPLP